MWLCAFVIIQCHPNSYINIMNNALFQGLYWIDLMAQYELLFLYGVVRGNGMETIVFLSLVCIFLWAMSDDSD